MEHFEKELQIRWSDLDPNVHLRHSVYYDWGALCRIEFLFNNGLTSKVMEQLQFGPIIFREECVFKREIRLGDKVTINLKLSKAKRDFSRWSIRHEVLKDGNIVAAILNLDGAWINVRERKLFEPPALVTEVFSKMPQVENFQWE